MKTEGSLRPIGAYAPAGGQKTEDRPLTCVRCLAHAERMVAHTKARATRAIEHLSEVKALEIPLLEQFAAIHVEQSLRAWRHALGKRAFEIRSLTSDL